jgi:hypothetical protein
MNALPYKKPADRRVGGNFGCFHVGRLWSHQQVGALTDAPPDGRVPSRHRTCALGFDSRQVRREGRFRQDKLFWCPVLEE